MYTVLSTLLYIYLLLSACSAVSLCAIPTTYIVNTFVNLFFVFSLQQTTEHTKRVKFCLCERIRHLFSKERFPFFHIDLHVFVYFIQVYDLARTIHICLVNFGCQKQSMSAQTYSICKYCFNYITIGTKIEYCMILHK